MANYEKAKKHGGTKAYKYVGTESEKFITGEYYTYEDMSELTGLSEYTLRSRMVKNKLKEDGHKVITDLQLMPKRAPFTNLDGSKSRYVAGECHTMRCETKSEIMMNKYLRLVL